MGKNLQKVQSMLDGDFKGYKTSVWMGGDAEIKREVGDRWVDADGKEWIQHKGYRSSVKNTPDVGIFSKVCSDCKSPCLKSYDTETHIRNGRCYKIS